MSDLALHVLKLARGVEYGCGLSVEFRRECLIACAARLIAGEYVLVD